jgi:hypothetical protein
VVLDRAHERLADPPDGVGRELEAAAVVELLDRADQAEVALLDQVREGEAEVAVVLRDCHDELQVVLDEAVLLTAHALVRGFDAIRPVEQRLARHLRARLELAIALRSAPRAAQIVGELAHHLAHLREHDQRELRRLHLLRDARVETAHVLLFALVDRLVALHEHAAQPLDRALDARGDLAGLLVADRLRELRTRVRQRAQLVPATHDVARAGRHRVETLAQLLRRGLELLREDHLLLASQCPGAADLLEVGFEGASLAPRIEILRGGSARRSAGSTGVHAGSLSFFGFHFASLDAPVHFRPRSSDTARALWVSNACCMKLDPALARRSRRPGPRRDESSGTRRGRMAGELVMVSGRGGRPDSPACCPITF